MLNPSGASMLDAEKQSIQRGPCRKRVQHMNKKVRKAVFPAGGLGTRFLPATKVIPKEMLGRLKVGKGDSLFAIETAEGYLLTPYDPAVAEEIKAGRQFMKEYRETFKALAE